MTEEELKYDLELVGVEMLERFGIEIRIIKITDGIIPINVKRPFSNFFKRKYLTLEGYDPEDKTLYRLRTYYNGLNIRVEIVSQFRGFDLRKIITKSDIEEISKKFCIQTGYKLSEFDLDEYHFSIDIYEPTKKYCLTDPINPILQSFRNK